MNQNADVPEPRLDREDISAYLPAAAVNNQRPPRFASLAIAGAIVGIGCFFLPFVGGNWTITAFGIASEKLPMWLVLLSHLVALIGSIYLLRREGRIIAGLTVGFAIIGLAVAVRYLIGLRENFLFYEIQIGGIGTIAAYVMVLLGMLIRKRREGFATRV